VAFRDTTDGDAEHPRGESEASQTWEQRTTTTTTGRYTTRDTNHTHGSTMHTARDTHGSALTRDTTDTANSVRSQSPIPNRYRGFSVAEEFRKIEENIYGDVFSTTEVTEGKIKDAEDKFFKSVNEGTDRTESTSLDELNRDSDIDSLYDDIDFSRENVELGCGRMFSCRNRFLNYTYIVLRRGFKWILPITLLSIFILFMASILFSKYEKGAGNWSYVCIVCLLEPAGCLCTILPWMRVHPPGKESESSAPRDKKGRRASLLVRADHRYFRAKGLHRRTATTIILFLTALKILAVVWQPRDTVYLFQPGQAEGDSSMAVGPKLLSLLYVASNQLLLFVYIPWLHREEFQPSIMTKIAKTLPFASIFTTTVELFVIDVHVVKAVDGVVYGVYGVVWLTEIIRSCGKPTNKDVGFFSTMLWINQMLPNAAGRVMYVLLIESELPVLLIAVFYWTFSAIFLQFMKRAAACATTFSISEAFVFQLQYTADLFFVLLYINTSFPGTTFFLLLIWNFVQVVFRDGDFIGMFQEWVRSLSCLNKPGDVGEDAARARAQNMRGTWRLLTIQNAMSERVAWGAAFTCVVFELGMHSFSDGVYNDVITICLDSKEHKQDAMWGYVIIGMTLLSSQQLASMVWNRRLLRTASGLPWAQLSSPTPPCAEDTLNFEGQLTKPRATSGGVEMDKIGDSKNKSAAGGGGVPRASSPFDNSRNGFRDERLSTISGSERSESVESNMRSTRGLSGLTMAKDRVSSVGSLSEGAPGGGLDEEVKSSLHDEPSKPPDGFEAPPLCPAPSGSSNGSGGLGLGGSRSQSSEGEGEGEGEGGAQDPPSKLCPAPSGSRDDLEDGRGVNSEVANMSAGSAGSKSMGSAGSGLRSRGGSFISRLRSGTDAIEIDLHALFNVKNFNPHASHRLYMKTFDVYFRAVIVYVMCSAFMGIANILAKKGCAD